MHNPKPVMVTPSHNSKSVTLTYLHFKGTKKLALVVIRLKEVEEYDPYFPYQRASHKFQQSIIFL